METSIDRRWMLRGSAAVGLGLAAAPVLAAARFDAVLTKDGEPHDGVPGFATLSAALEAAPAGGRRPFRVLVRRGEWRERNVVTKPDIHLIGEDRAASILVCNASRRDRKPGEDATATLLVRAPGFAAANLTIANDYDYLGTPPPPTGAQAQAIMLDRGADRSLFDQVTITGYQDTLWTEVGRALFRRCRITGCVDFIYGGSSALFDRCEIVSRLRPGKEIQGYLTAPDTNVRQPYGLVFIGCRLSKEPGLPPRSVALGRPWKHARTFADGTYSDPEAIGQAVFIRCWMDDHIVPEGWYHMRYTRKDGSQAFAEPEDARFFEFGSYGPGAGAASARRRVLSASEAASFTPDRILGGWRPDRSV